MELKSELIQHAGKFLFSDRHVTFSSYVKQVIADLLQNKIDMSQLVITKALAKAGAYDIVSVKLRR